MRKKGIVPAQKWYNEHDNIHAEPSTVCRNTFQITEPPLGAQAARLHWSGQFARAPRNAHASLKGIAVCRARATAHINRNRTMYTPWEERFAAFLLQNPEPTDVAHDMMHVRRVVATAKQLAAIEGARLEVVVPAAWLHDCVTVPKHAPQRSQASRKAANTAVLVLREWCYPEQYIADIHHAIEAHSFSARIPPRTLEAKVVQDADRLDAIGAIGIARCLMLGGMMGKPLYHATQPFPTTRQPDDTSYVLDHFYAKLLQIAEGMQTHAGRDEAQRRTIFMQEFLQQLAEDIGREE